MTRPTRMRDHTKLDLKRQELAKRDFTRQENVTRQDLTRQVFHTKQDRVRQE